MSANDASAELEHQDFAETNQTRSGRFGPGIEAWELPMLGQAGSRDERIAMAIRCASLAPSSHNSQPWFFRATEHAIEVHADRARALPVVDPHGRELVVSCGGAVFQLALAARVLRIGTRVQAFPEGTEASCMARVFLEDSGSPTEEDLGLFAEIPRRRTYRMALDARPVPPAVVSSLIRAAQTEGASLAFLEGAQRAPVAALVAEGNRIQGRDVGFRRELASWLRHKEEGYADGMLGRSFGLGAVTARAFPFVVRAFDWGAAQAEKDAKATRDAPLLAALTTEEDSAHAWLVTGRALARVLLVARAHGLFASFFNQPVQVPALRAALAEVCGDEPQLLFRLGHAEEIPPSLRRSLESIWHRSP
jgi:nitroreductase